jgi:hypothetical protein
MVVPDPPGFMDCSGPQARSKSKLAKAVRILNLNIEISASMEIQ